MDRNRSIYDSFVISDQTMENLARLLTPQARLMLFNELCESVGSRIPERIWLATDIRKTDVYRYFPKSKSRRGGHIPNSVTTVKVIKALLKYGRCELVVKTLEPAEDEMHKCYKEFFKWKKLLKKSNVVYDPLSDSEIRRIKRSMW
jgi:hypothetical protein